MYRRPTLACAQTLQLIPSPCILKVTTVSILATTLARSAVPTALSITSKYLPNEFIPGVSHVHTIRVGCAWQNP